MRDNANYPFCRIPPLATVARAVTNSASVAELADDWLTAKRALESAAQAEKGHSDRARRADLECWAVVLGEIRGRCPTRERAAPCEPGPG